MFARRDGARRSEMRRETGKKARVRIGLAAQTALVASLIAFVAACAGRRPVEEGRSVPTRERAGLSSALDVVRLYRQLGMFGESTPVPFIGTTYTLASGSPDTSLVLLTLSLPSRGLTFVREGDHYRASYDVLVDARQGGTSIRKDQGRQTVRVSSYKETTRGDESVIFQQYLRLPPGAYTLGLTVRDAESARTVTREIPLIVRGFGAGTAVSSAIPVYQANLRVRRDTLPALVPNPRATAIFGQDTVLSLYVESYAGQALQAEVRNMNGEAIWRDTVALRAGSATLSSGVVPLPVTQLGPGVATFVAWTGAGDTTRTPLVVSFGEGLAITSFEDMLSYLRYFALAETLAPLRSAEQADRGRAWIAFLRSTDPDPATPEHEALRDYFVRIEQANLRYREEGIPGWLTDRGRVFVSLGDPDQIYEQGQGDIAQRSRVQIWEYAEYRAQLVFIDQSGFGRYRLTTAGEVEFQSLVRRVRRR